MANSKSNLSPYSNEESLPYLKQLRMLRARIRGDTSHLADSALNRTRSEAAGDLSSMPIHMADIGSDNYEQEFSLNLIEAEQVTLGEIDSALERIVAGEYGCCTRCRNRIKKSRLNAIPFTSYCIDCANKRDHETNR